MHLLEMPGLPCCNGGEASDKTEVICPSLPSLRKHVTAGGAEIGEGYTQEDVSVTSHCVLSTPLQGQGCN